MSTIGQLSFTMGSDGSGYLGQINFRNVLEKETKMIHIRFVSCRKRMRKMEILYSTSYVFIRSVCVKGGGKESCIITFCIKFFLFLIFPCIVKDNRFSSLDRKSPDAAAMVKVLVALYN